MSAFDPKRTSRDHAENRGLHPAAPEWRPAIAEAAANGLGKMSDVEDVAVDVCLRGSDVYQSKQENLITFPKTTRHLGSKNLSQCRKS